MTGDWRGKPDKDQSRERYWWKVVDEKHPDPGGVLGRKPTPYDWGLQGQGSQFRYETWKSKSRYFDEGQLEVTCSHVQSCAVMCCAAEDIVCVRYLNSSKNTIKIKHSSVVFSSFVIAIGWSSLLLFGRSSRLDYQSSHWYCGVNSRRSRSWHVRMVLVEQANELSEVLDRWSWLPSILFFWISFPWDQIVET